jgi:arginine repressor
MKRKRQDLIMRIITDSEIETQIELMEALKREGVKARRQLFRAISRSLCLLRGLETAANTATQSPVKQIM